VACGGASDTTRYNRSTRRMTARTPPAFVSRGILAPLAAALCLLDAPLIHAVSAHELDVIHDIFRDRCNFPEYATLHAQIQCVDQSAPSGPALQLFDRLAKEVEQDMQSRNLSDYRARTDLLHVLSQEEENLFKHRYTEEVPQTQPTTSQNIGTFQEPPQTDPMANQSIGTFQAECDAGHGFKTFNKQVGCIKDLIASSGPYGPQPEVMLYSLTADKLVEDVKAGRLRPAAARVELQKAYLEVLDREHARDAEQRAQVAREVAAKGAEERERRAVQVAEEAREAARQQQALERADAVQNCIQQVRARREALWAHDRSGAAVMQRSAINLGGDPIEKNCSTNPNAYQAIPLPRPVTTCQGDGWQFPYSSSMDVDMTCTTE
jgi:hypothetical protein